MNAIPELPLHLLGVHECHLDGLVLGHSLVLGQLVLVVHHYCLVTVVNDVGTGPHHIGWGKL